MVENTISQLTPIVKNTDDIRFLSIGSLPAVLSTEVAKNFQKKHSDVLREIDRLRSILPKTFVERNFAFLFRIVPTGNGGTRKVRQCALTRDALSLLVMGFTGKAAIMWKLRYIEAFNAMEARLRRMALLERPAAPTSERTEVARLIWKLGPAQKRRLRAVLRYRSMGLGAHNIAKLLDVHKREVSMLLKAADALGWLSAAPRLVQGNLLEVDHD